MKNWKILVLFGLIAALFVFAGCIGGTTTPEETPTPTVAPTSTPTPTPTPAGTLTVDTVSFLGTNDNYLNIADSKVDATVSGTFTGERLLRVKVYAVKLQPIEGCAACASACDQPETGDPIFLGEEIFSTPQTGVNIAWSVTVSAATLAGLEDGTYKIYAVGEVGACGTCGAVAEVESAKKCFTVDLTAPKLTCECCGFEGTVDSTELYGLESVDVTGVTCDCVNGSTDSSLKVVASVTPNPTTQYVSASGTFVWFAQRVDATQVKFFNSAGDEVVVNAGVGETASVTLSGVKLDVTFTSNINTCCPDKLTIVVSADDTKTSTSGKITVGFSEDVKLGGSSASVYINNNTSAESWGLKGDELTNQAAGLYADSWSFYVCDSDTTDAAVGANFRIVPPTFTDKAGNSGSADDFCKGVFRSGDVICP